MTHLTRRDTRDPPDSEGPRAIPAYMRPRELSLKLVGIASESSLWGEPQACRESPERVRVSVCSTPCRHVPAVGGELYAAMLLACSQL